MLKWTCVILVMACAADAASRSIADVSSDSDLGLYDLPANGGARRFWIKSDGGSDPLTTDASSGANAVTRLPKGALVSNLGCALSEEGIWCRVRSFRGGPSAKVPAQDLEPARGLDGRVILGPDDSRARARKRDFDASGEISCAQEIGEELGFCEAHVARSTGGDATLVAVFPNGFARKLYFVHGEFVRANATMSGAGRDTDWRFEKGLHTIRVDDQKYEMLDALVFGASNLGK